MHNIASTARHILQHIKKARAWARHAMRCRYDGASFFFQAYGNVALAILAFLMLYGLLFLTSPHHKPVLRIYGWVHYVPKAFIQDFEKRHHVRVVYDVFDTPETMEGKLLVARSGYDLVFAPSFPTASLFVPAGVFRPLDFKQLPNSRYLRADIMNKLQAADPTQRFLIPYLWGTTGLIYHKEKMEALQATWKTDVQLPLKSWKLLLHPKYAKLLASLRLVLLDSPAEVIPDVLLALDLPPYSQSVVHLQQAVHRLMKLRPFIYRFASDIVQDLLAERIGVAEVFSSYAHMAMQKLKAEKGTSPYVYVLPKEGAQMWIDVMAIPKDARNVRLAHAFMNDLMEPRIIAQATNSLYVANAISGSHAWVNPNILNDATIYPPPHVMRRLHIESRAYRKRYQRLRLRLWTLVRTGFLRLS